MNSIQLKSININIKKKAQSINDKSKIVIFYLKSNIAIFVSIVSGAWHNVGSPVTEHTEMLSCNKSEEPPKIIE